MSCKQLQIKIDKAIAILKHNISTVPPHGCQRDKVIAVLEDTEHLLCEHCGELEFNVLHHDTSLNTPIKPLASVEHYDECNYDADYQGEERGWVATMDCHEFEAGCYCGEKGRCVVCIDQAVDYADHMRDAAKEG